MLVFIFKKNFFVHFFVLVVMLVYHAGSDLANSLLQVKLSVRSLPIS